MTEKQKLNGSKPVTTYENNFWQKWHDSEEFQAICHKSKNVSALADTAMWMLYEYANHVKKAKIPGTIAEFGVWRGGTANLLAKVFENRTIYLFDTFKGMPETNKEKDLHLKDDFNDTSLKLVQDFLAEYNYLDFRVGFFPDTTKGLENESFAFVHVDCDIYQSAKDACDFFYPRLNPGGIMVFDDYGIISCKGLKECVDEFFEDKPEYVIYNLACRGFIIKQ